jgi:predicted HTH domain antitoxin
MNRHDTIELIVDHAIQQGRYSANYMAELSAMTDTELDLELDRLEQLAIFGQ